jgi:hypothetical protein
MIKLLADTRPLLGRERAADLGQHLGRADRARPRLGVGQQVSQGGTTVGVGDRAAQRPPQPLDPVGIRVVGRGVDHHQRRRGNDSLIWPQGRPE